VTRPVRVVGLGGSLRAGSTSRTALQVGLEGAAAAGADVQLIWVGDLGLPLYTPEHAPPAGAHEFADARKDRNAMELDLAGRIALVTGASKGIGRVLPAFPAGANPVPVAARNLGSLS
jgi:FMN reductase